MRLTLGLNIHGVLAADCSVQCAMPNGNAAMGSVLPREKAGVESVPCSTLTASTGLVNLAEDSPIGAVLSAARPGLRVAEARVEPTTARPEPLRKFRLLVPVFLSLTVSFTISAKVPLPMFPARCGV